MRADTKQNKINTARSRAVFILLHMFVDLFVSKSALHTKPN